MRAEGAVPDSGRLAAGVRLLPGVGARSGQASRASPSSRWSPSPAFGSGRAELRRALPGALRRPEALSARTRPERVGRANARRRLARRAYRPAAAAARTAATGRSPRLHSRQRPGSIPSHREPQGCVFRLGRTHVRKDCGPGPRLSAPLSWALASLLERA